MFSFAALSNPFDKSLIALYANYTTFLFCYFHASKDSKPLMSKKYRIDHGDQSKYHKRNVFSTPLAAWRTPNQTNCLIFLTAKQRN